MTSDTSGHLSICVVTRKLDLENLRRGNSVPIKLAQVRGGTAVQTTCVLSIDGVTHENAQEIVGWWREANPSVPHEAEWKGPTRL